MDLERVAVRLRPRSGWESADLGIALARHWRLPIYGRWVAMAARVAILTVTLAGGYGLMLFWWLLPLLEVVVLFTVSRAVFGATPGGRETLRALPELWRRGFPEIFLRRLHPARILYLPVGQLEGLRGKERRGRCAALAVGQDVPAMLVATFMLFELGLVLAVVVLAMLMIPSSLGIDWELFTERFFNGTLSQASYNACWLLVALTLALLHPVYVTAGFALYLNRRTELEGWDLEIAFRRLAQKATAAPMLVMLLALAMTATGLAAETQAPKVDPAVWNGDPERDPRRLIAEVMTRPELQREETVHRWRLRTDLFDGLESDGGSSPSRSLIWLGETLALVGEPLLWLLAAGLLVLLIRAMWRHLAEGGEPSSRPERARVEQIAGLDLRPETLPGDIPGTAADLWHDGQPTAALSLLYRGAVARLAEEGVKLRESFTEDDCLSSAGAHLEVSRLEVFADLTRSWQRVAYAHRVPSATDAQRLWSVWGEHFGGAT